MRKNFLIENSIKNLLLIILFLLLLIPLKKVLLLFPRDNYNNILTVTTLLIMASLFADYAFSYNNRDPARKSVRYLGHLISFLIMLCTGVLLEITIIVINFIFNGFFWPTAFISVIFYLSLILYDFWDLLKEK